MGTTEEEEGDPLLVSARTQAKRSGSGAIAPRTGGEMNMTSEIGPLSLESPAPGEGQVVCRA